MHAHKWLLNPQAVLEMIPLKDRACQLELNNCHVNEEYRTNGELTLDEIRDAEKQITKNV